MTVREVFELRRQGKIEEAYETIRPMYAVHKGKYTTLCMFWTASDILKKRINEQRFDEAGKILKALLRILPNIDDTEGRARISLLNEALMLDRKDKNFSMLDFVSQLNVNLLSNNVWEETAPWESTCCQPRPSIAQQLLTCAFHEIQEEPTTDNALKVMPLLQEAMRRHPQDKDNQSYMAVIYRIMGEEEKAIANKNRSNN